MPFEKILLIAEIGSVHDGSFGNAMKLIDLASECGANAVKFQTHIADCETLPTAPNPRYFSSESSFVYFTRTSFSFDQWVELRGHAHELGLKFISSPFSIEAVDMLESIGVDAIKVPSGEISNLPMLEKISDSSRDIIISSGMSDWKELDLAVDVLSAVKNLAILQCSSIYPCPAEKVGLNVIREMQERYNRPIGLSDHTLGIGAAIAAVAFGAVVIEKHLTFHRGMYGSDATHSAEPHEYKLLSDTLGQVCSMLMNDVRKDDVTPYKDMKKIFEKSLVSKLFINKGEKLSKENLCFKKPGDGIPASEYKNWLGRISIRDIPPNSKLQPQDFQA